jgi:hypothetical protein
MKTEDTLSKKNRHDRKTHLTGQAHETFLDYVGQAAVERAGLGKQLKGVAHEVLFREQQNLSSERLLHGLKVELTTSTNARTVDAVAMSNGQVSARYQLKDLTSQAGQRDLAQRLKAGQYKSVRLVGTRETADIWNSSGHPRKMQASGISSDTTTRIADNQGARVPNKDLLQGNLQDIGHSATLAGGAGIVFGAGAAALQNFTSLTDGEITTTQYVGRVAEAGARSGVEATLKTGAALGLKEVAKATAKAVGSQPLRQLAGSNPGTAVAFGVVEQTLDTVQFCRGKIDGAEFGQRSLGNVGGTGGAIAGAAAGAALGSAVPVVGTVIGGVIGGLFGAISGGWLGRATGRKLF